MIVLIYSSYHVVHIYIIRFEVSTSSNFSPILPFLPQKEEPNIDPKTKKALRIPKRMSSTPDPGAYHSLSNIREGAEENEGDEKEDNESYDGSYDGSYSVGE